MSMRTVLRLAAPAAVIAALVSPSLAADYDPPIIIDDAPEVVPVEVGSGWYLRGDVGYTFANGTEDDDDLPGFGFEEDQTDIFGGAGFGYHFTDYFRADLTGAFLQKEETTLASGGLRGSIETNMGYGMATGYVDLGTVAGITPYIGAGAGFIYSQSSSSGDVDVGGEPFPGAYSEDDFAFAYTLNAGFAYRMTQNLSLDVGYQYLNSPDAQHFSATSPGFAEEGFDMHQVKVGLRYDLW
jgi:opacity protein-like surface antigen